MVLTIAETSSDVICAIVAGVHSVRFHRCRAGDFRGQLFTIDECPAGQVMNVQFAEMGWSQSYNPDANPPQCPQRNCTENRTNSIAPMCNGHRSCSISQDLLIYPQGSALCALQKDANFIRIEFTCVIGMTFCLLFIITLHKYRIIITVLCYYNNVQCIMFSNIKAFASNCMVTCDIGLRVLAHVTFM